MFSTTALWRERETDEVELLAVIAVEVSLLSGCEWFIIPKEYLREIIRCIQ